MAVDFTLWQARKVHGAKASSLDNRTGQNPAFGFFGPDPSGAGAAGYTLLPTTQNLISYPVRKGGSSWEVWLTGRFNGLAFVSITDIRFRVESISGSGLGTLPSAFPDDYVVPPVTSGVMNRTGISMRTHAGPIERGLDANDVSTFTPSSAPGFGPPSDRLFQPGNIDDYIDITPLQSSDNIGVDPGEPFGTRRIMVGNAEPRYCNWAVVSMILANDATVTGQYNPFVFEMSWSES